MTAASPVFSATNADHPAPAISNTTIEGKLHHLASGDLLAGLAHLASDGWLEFQPSQIKLSFAGGCLIGASGAEPLGQILMRRGVLGETELQLALKEAKLRGVGLGQVLLGHELVSAAGLQAALTTQILIAVNTLLLMPQKRFRWTASDQTPQLHAPQLSIERALLDAATASDELAAGPLPLDAALRLTPQPERVGVLSINEWRLIALVNGRRGLRSMLRRMDDGQGTGWLTAYRAATSLHQRGLIEFAQVQGLQTIILARQKEVRASYHPPAGMVASLFLKKLNGERNCFEIAQGLNLSEEEAAKIITALYRDGVIEIISGKTEVERLLEEY
jgi:hypothetical protein